jgi:hypothetical protein
VFVASSGTLKHNRPTTHSTAMRIARACVAVALLLCPAPGLPQSGANAESRSEANAIANFPSFIEWPLDPIVTPQTPFLFCVYGNSSFGNVLAVFTRGQRVQGRRVDVRLPRNDNELRNCQILFIGRSERKHYAKILAVVQGASVLTIGETADFNEWGGIVEFAYEHDALLFEVNLSAARDAHLKISSRFLSLARRFVNTTADAKN